MINYKCIVIFDKETKLPIATGDNEVVAWAEAAKWYHPDCSQQDLPSTLRKIRKAGAIACEMKGELYIPPKSKVRKGLSAFRR